MDFNNLDLNLVGDIAGMAILGLCIGVAILKAVAERRYPNGPM